MAHTSPSSSSSLPTPPPGDEDLRELYQQVWRGFVEDSPVSADTPISDASPTVGRDLDALPSYNRPEHNPRTDYTDAKPPIPGFPTPMPAVPSGVRPLPSPGPSSLMSPNVRRSRPLPAPPISMASPPPPPPPLLDGPSHSQQSKSYNGHSASSSVSTITRSTTVPSSAAHNGVRPLPRIDLESSGSPPPFDHTPRPHHSDSLPVPGYNGGVRVLETRSPSPSPSMLTPTSDSLRAAMPDPYYPLPRTDDGQQSPVRPRGAGPPAIPGHSVNVETSPTSAYSPGSNYSMSPHFSLPYDRERPESSYTTGRRTTNGSSFAYGDAFDSNPSTPRARDVVLDDDTDMLARTMSSSTARTDQTGRYTSSSEYPPSSTQPTSIDRTHSMHSVDSFDSYKDDGYDGYETFVPDSGSPYADATPYEQALHGRQPSVVLSSPSVYSPYTPVAGPSTRHTNDFERMHAIKLELHDEEDEQYDEEDEEEEEDDVDRFVNLALLSHIAVKVRDQVPRGTHVKGGIPYQRAFTGRNIVDTIQHLVQRDLMVNLNIQTNQDRQIALQVARSLQSQLFFYEVEWGGRILSDSVEDVYMFLDDEVEGMSDGAPREELPTSVVTVLTKCYSASCVDGDTCFSYACPRRTGAALLRQQSTVSVVESPEEQKREWTQSVEPAVLHSLPESEVRRQGIIHKVISKEEQYVQDLDTLESLFIRSLRRSLPPVMPSDALEEFIEDVFGNVLELRQRNRRLLEAMAVRKREQAPIIQWIGDIFLNAAADFRQTYPIYVGHLPVAEKRVKDEAENNAEFRKFLEQCARHPDSRRLDLKHFISRPSEHLLKYPVLLEAILHETDQENPDAGFLTEAIQAMRNLSTIAQLRTFQSAMGRGPTNKLQWHELVAPEVRETISKKEAKRQAIIFEVIQTEMVYVRDLEVIVSLFVRPLRAANPPIIPRDRLSQFIQDVFYNVNELYKHHRKMLDRLHEIQRDEHPLIISISEPIFDAALNWREAYMEYIPHYPIAAYRIDDEMANNPAFKAFVEQCTRHPDARRLDMKAFINRPIPRLLRYELLLKAILDETPRGHEDHESIPQILDIIKDLGKATEPGVTTAKQKVELWRYNANLVFKPGEMVDMDLLDETRTLIHTGKLLRQPETGFEWNGWSELFVLLFDNYLVMTKPKERDGVTKYQVNRRPIPLDLLSMVNFVDPPQQRGTGILRGLRHGTSDASNQPNPSGNMETDSRLVYPCTIHHNGRMGGLYTLYAESAAARVEWLQKLQEATGLRSVVQESNKVFEIEPLSSDTFLVPQINNTSQQPTWSEDSQYTGKVTCSVPFSTADGRGLVAIGCAEGVWIGLRHDSRSLKRVLHLKHVTQCAMLEDFGIFLVLADKSLFAYHIEALVPSQPTSHMQTARTPQKLNGNKDVQFFSVGTLNGRTLVIYMKKKGLDSVFRVLEPVTVKIAEKQKNPGAFGRFGFGQHRSEWFRIYRQDFFLPSEAYDLIFLKAKIAILCQKGFEIMDLSDFKSVTIPQRDDPRLQPLAKRCEACRPLGMFRTSENEFLLCYNEFGLYVDRHGDPSRSTGTIEWEGTAEKVAWHPPYILLFDSRFIEIRHIDTGRLVQIIPGNDIRCLWDGRGGGAPPVMTPGPDGWQDGTSQESRVHAAMRAEPMPGMPRVKGSYQHVFELVPTIPLYLPGSLSSPGADTYFPPASPPLSPRMSTSSWPPN